MTKFVSDSIILKSGILSANQSQKLEWDLQGSEISITHVTYWPNKLFSTG